MEQNSNTQPDGTNEDYTTTDPQKEEKKKFKKSYVERALYNFVENQLLGGYKVLSTKKYLPYFIYVIALTCSSIGFVVLEFFKVPIPTEILQLLLILGLFSGLSLILGGIFGGLSTNGKTVDILTLILLVGSIVSAIFVSNYDDLILQWLKLGFFVAYVLIGSITMFFIILNFHTSIEYKLVTLGNSQNRMFFQEIIRFGAWITLPMYVYLFFQNTLDAKILAVIGFIFATIIIYSFNNLPFIEKKENFEVKETKKARMNFYQSIGYYNFFLIYHISQSYNTGGQISNFIIDFVLLLFNSFYLINCYSRKVDEIEDYNEVQRRTFNFQRPNSTTMRFKRRIGEKGMIFIALGIAVGYNTVMLDSYLGSPIVLLQNIGNAPLNVIYHRMWTYAALILMICASIIFNSSRDFQQKVINRYSFRHAWKMFGDMFRVSDEGNVGVVLEKYEESKQKIVNVGNQVKDRVKKKWNQFFSLGDSDPDPQN
ncbi:hypothetical protein [Candidatus Lokiarchaeum ossiferum]|uniref:hypothetical protein n=1 Tax=Candidatus Lokiarchaeum ossiferum TaxID=2951803 RepID=UPI00352CCDC2